LNYQRVVSRRSCIFAKISSTRLNRHSPDSRGIGARIVPLKDSRRDSSQDEDALIGRALHQHKLHFSEVYGLRRDQSGRIFLKNDRLVFHEGE
jgi:hypothetical protein